MWYPLVSYEVKLKFETCDSLQDTLKLASFGPLICCCLWITSELINSCVEDYLCIFYSFKWKVPEMYGLGHTILCIKIKWHSYIFAFLSPVTCRGFNSSYGYQFLFKKKSHLGSELFTSGAGKWVKLWDVIRGKKNRRWNPWPLLHQCGWC